MDGPGDIEAIARTIAENAIEGLERQSVGVAEFAPGERGNGISVVMMELMQLLPSGTSDQLAAACNRGFRRFAILGPGGPQVAAVDPGDGSVTMRQG